MSLSQSDNHVGTSHGVDHDHESDPFANLDPSLHPQTLDSMGGDDDVSSHQDRLTRFAQHVLTDADAQDAPSFLLGSGADEGTLFSAAGDSRFGELLEAAGEAEAGHLGIGVASHVSGNGRVAGNGNANPTVGHGVIGGDASGVTVGEDGADKGGDEEYHEYNGDGENGEGEEGKEPGAKFGRIIGRKRRRDENEPIVVGPVENGEPIDPVKMKKDSHKEVERRRRENINDGINEIARFVPGAMDGKVGKGLLLHRAAEYISDLCDKVARFDEDLAKIKQEKDALQAELNEMRQKYQEESSRSIRFEVSWRDAEDRAAAAQFQSDRVNARLAMLDKSGEETEDPAATKE